jgi:hypothetical protein
LRHDGDSLVHLRHPYDIPLDKALAEKAFTDRMNGIVVVPTADTVR